MWVILYVNTERPTHHNWLHRLVDTGVDTGSFIRTHFCEALVRQHFLRLRDETKVKTDRFRRPQSRRSSEWRRSPRAARWHIGTAIWPWFRRRPWSGSGQRFVHWHMCTAILLIRTACRQSARRRRPTDNDRTRRSCTEQAPPRTEARSSSPR